MKYYVACDSSGKITHIYDLLVPPGHTGIIEVETDLSQLEVLLGYMAEGENLVPIPPCPSPHHVFNYTTKQWDDPRTLEELKATQWVLIKEARAEAEYAGFQWEGLWFDSDPVSQNRLTGALGLAQLSPDFVIEWTLKDNSTVTLNQAGMIGVAATLGQHVQTQFVKGQTLRTQIDAATTPEAVTAVVW